MKHAGIVRLPDVTVSQRIEMLRDVLTRHSGDLQAGSVVTVQRQKMRVSKV